MDRLEAMEAFVVTVDRGSLSGAARALGRSVPAVSRSLAALEERLGVSLLRRTTRALHLTEPGARYLESARRVLADLALAEQTAGSALESPRGTLTVTAPLLFGSLHVRPALDSYLAKHAEVRARLMLLDRVVSLLDEGIDAAVRIAHLPDSSLVAVALGTVRRVLCASPKYLARHGHPRSPRDLAEHRCVASTAINPTDSWKLKGARVKVQAALTVNTAQAAIDSAIDGSGITAALSYQVDSAVRAGRLAIVLAKHEPEPLPVHLVVPAGSTRVAKVRAFVDHAVPLLRAAL